MASLDEVFPESGTTMGSGSSDWEAFVRMTHDGRCIKRQQVPILGMCRCTPAERINLLRNLMNAPQFYKPEFSRQARQLLHQLEQQLKDTKELFNPHNNYLSQRE
jgi:CTP synthase (UTP-ammonia lyase)